VGVAKQPPMSQMGDLRVLRDDIIWEEGWVLLHRSLSLLSERPEPELAKQRHEVVTHDTSPSFHPLVDLVSVRSRKISLGYLVRLVAQEHLMRGRREGFGRVRCSE
jgi:hypothetical protein